jgi:hypothetical protein
LIRCDLGLAKYILKFDSLCVLVAMLGLAAIPQCFKELIVKLIQTFKSSTHMCKVVWNKEYEEYVCKLYRVSGFVFKHVKGADYFTNDKQDALGTASLMLQQISK